MVTQEGVARHLDLSQAAVSKLASAGVLKPVAGARRYDLDECRVAYIRHLRATAAGRDSSRPGSLESERARLAAAQAEAAERKNARDRGELAPLDDMIAAGQAVIGMAVSRLQLVGPHVANGDQPLRRRIEAAIDDALSELSLARIEEVARSNTGDGR